MIKTSKRSKRRSKRPNAAITVDKRPKRIAPSNRTSASRVTDFNDYVRSTVPSDVPPSHICNGPTCKGLCKMPAGRNTDHSGVGRCRVHESRTPIAVRNKAQGLAEIKSKYGTGPPTNLKIIYEKMLTDDGLMGVHDEMAASKAMLSSIMDSISEVDFQSDEGQNTALKFLKAFEGVARLTLKYQELQHKSDFIITLPQFVKIVKQIGVIVSEELVSVDPVVATRLKRRLASELDITGRAAMANEGAIDATYDVEDDDVQKEKAQTEVQEVEVR